MSAGPFSWGPAVGGEGVRTELSLPNIGKTVGAVAGMSIWCSVLVHKYVFFKWSLFCHSNDMLNIV